MSPREELIRTYLKNTSGATSGAIVSALRNRGVTRPYLMQVLAKLRNDGLLMERDDPTRKMRKLYSISCDREKALQEDTVSV